MEGDYMLTVGNRLENGNILIEQQFFRIDRDQEILINLR